MFEGGRIWEERKLGINAEDAEDAESTPTRSGQARGAEKRRRGIPRSEKTFGAQKARCARNDGASAWNDKQIE